MLFKPERDIRRPWRSLLVAVGLVWSAWQPAQVYSFPASSEGGDEALSALGLNAVQGRRAFEAGSAAFKQEDYVLARRHWAPVARRGHTRSQFYMGLLHDARVGVRPDAARAAIWFRRAARQGLPEAQHKLALAYARGEGVPRDISRALRWWLRAARGGNTDSQYNLGVIYTLGRDGIGRDPHKAAHWWRQAAIGGDPMAQYNLGTFYANGDAGQTDLCQALHWWRKSQSNGLPQADDALAALRHRFDAQGCQLTGP